MSHGEEIRDLVLTDAEYRMFADLFREYCGLHFGEDSRYLLEKRLARRIHEVDAGSFSAYHYMLRRDTSGDQELAHVVDELTTNETYFFRERRQLRALFEEILPELRMRREAEGQSVLSIWSAGCSSGEEPYSIVMLALEAGIEMGREIRVYASDISRRMLKKARHGVYRPASFRETEPHIKEKYFAEKDGLWRISDEIKRHVVFTRLNLLDRGCISLLGTMDVILCRNVIIYFDLETKQEVIRTFSEKLRAGGYLLLGHSESLIRVSDAFELENLRHDLVYRKPIAGETRWDPRHAAAAAAIGTSAPEGLGE